MATSTLHRDEPSNTYACPRCRAALLPVDAGLRCADCAIDYAVVDGIPLLVAAGDYASRTYCELWREEQRLLQTAGANEEEVARGVTHPMLAPIAAGLRKNAAMLRGQRDLIAPLVVLDDALFVMAGGDDERFSYSEGQTRYAVRDWGRDPRAERENEQTLALVDRGLNALEQRGGRALVLGAGMGRYAWELRTRFDEVFAVDLSFSMMATFAAIARGPVTVYDTSLMNMPTDNDMVREMTLQALPPAGGPAGVLHRAVAQADQLPFADSTFDAVVSIFFTDSLPLSALVPEIARVCRPNAAFVSVGANNWSFERPRAERLSAAAVKAALDERGLKVALFETEAVEHLSSPSLTHRVYDVVTIAARVSHACLGAAVTRASTVALVPGSAVVTTGLWSDYEDDARTEVELLGGERVEVPLPLVELLFDASAKCSVDALVRRALDEELIDDEEELLDALRDLVDAGALRIVID